MVEERCCCLCFYPDNGESRTAITTITVIIIAREIDPIGTV